MGMGNKEEKEEVMSWGAVPVSLILDLAKRDGAMYQLEFDLQTPIWVFVNPEHLTSEINGVSYDKGHGACGVTGTEDHPRFRDTRNFLEREGYIRTERGWCNGDRVTKPFFFNNVLLTEGDQFSCASAMAYGFSDNYNDGKPIYDLKNYKEDEDISW